MKSIFKFCLIIGISFIGISCGDEETDVDSFDRSLILTNLADNIIVPSYNDLATTTSNLVTQSASLDLDAPGSLIDLRNAWREAKLAWSRTEVYNFGPIDQMSFNLQINSFPTNEFGIENFIENQNAVTLDNVLALPTNQQGFPALEYLLFSQDAEQKLNENPVRIEMIQALSQRLAQISNTVRDEWQDSFRQTFVEATGKDLGGSVTLVVNGFIEFLELSRTSKIAIPLGFITDGEALPEQVESNYNNISKEILIENLSAIQAIFNGGAANGFDDYLNELDIESEEEPLADVINNQFIATIDRINDIPGNLQTAVSDSPMEVNFSLSEWQRLVVLLKTDMTSQLGIIVTFSDNDGD